MADSKRLALTGNWAEEAALLKTWVQSAKSNRTLEILEAGCGQRWDIDLADTDYHLTGVDLDPVALRLRLDIAKDLDRAVEGDLRTVDLPAGSFDVIYNSYVLEHIAGAEMVLDNFVEWLRPNGIVLLRIPDPKSVHGFMSRATPHWLHVLYFRLVLRRLDAGKPGHAPYRVHYDPIVSRSGIHAFCRTRGIAVLAEYGTGGFVQPGSGAMRHLVAIFKRLAFLLTLGHLTTRHRDLLFVLKKAQI